VYYFGRFGRGRRTDAIIADLRGKK